MKIFRYHLLFCSPSTKRNVLANFRKARNINFRETLLSRSPVVSCLQMEAAILVGGQKRFECAEYI